MSTIEELTDEDMAEMRRQELAPSFMEVNWGRLSREDLLHQLRFYYKACVEDGLEISNILAEALGYGYDEQFGYLIGDHTSVTLAREAARKLER